MTITARSLVVWGAYAALGLTLELMGLWRVGHGWITLSETVWYLEAKWRLLACAIAGALFVLTLHFAFRWPERFPTS